jgi:Flp pilus assembly protein TadB
MGWWFSDEKRVTSKTESHDDYFFGFIGGNKYSTTVSDGEDEVCAGATTAKEAEAEASLLWERLQYKRSKERERAKAHAEETRRSDARRAEAASKSEIAAAAQAAVYDNDEDDDDYVPSYGTSSRGTRSTLTFWMFVGAVVGVPLLIVLGLLGFKPAEVIFVALVNLLVGFFYLLFKVIGALLGALLGALFR